MRTILSSLLQLRVTNAEERLESGVFGPKGSLPLPAQPLVKTLSNGAATSILDISLPSGARVGGWVEYTVLCTDGTDHEVLTAMSSFSAVNKAGTITPVTTDYGSAMAKSSAVGLVVTSSLVAGSSKVTFKLTATSLLTPTLLQARFSFKERTGTAVTIL